MITKEDLDRWKADDTTKEVFAYIKEQMEICKTSGIELGRTEITGHRVASNAARYDALKEILTIKSDEETEEVE